MVSWHKRNYMRRVKKWTDPRIDHKILTLLGMVTFYCLCQRLSRFLFIVQLPATWGSTKMTQRISAFCYRFSPPLFYLLETTFKTLSQIWRFGTVNVIAFDTNNKNSRSRNVYSPEQPPNCCGSGAFWNSRKATVAPTLPSCPTVLHGVQSHANHVSYACVYVGACVWCLLGVCV